MLMNVVHNIYDKNTKSCTIKFIDKIMTEVSPNLGPVSMASLSKVAKFSGGFSFLSGTFFFFAL